MILDVLLVFLPHYLLRWGFKRSTAKAATAAAAATGEKSTQEDEGLKGRKE